MNFNTLLNTNVLIALAAVALLVSYRRKFFREWQRFRLDRRAWLYEKWKNWGEPFVVAAILAVIIRTFLVGPYKIPTGSMRPTFLEEDKIFVDKISYRFHEPVRGDIIVFRYPMDRKKDFVKRLVGLPGEKIQITDGKLVVNGRELGEAPFADHYYYNREDWPYGKMGQVIEVPEGHYFALGDNSAQSSDSRNWGFVPRKDVIGKAFCIWWPPQRIKLTD
ncbi:MAG: signal peptidase I [Candidatus Omnitrophota bacterium]|jgi:signal peptidase I